MSEINHSDALQSPCVRNCCLNQKEICMGCFRSVDEISGWNHASNDERQKILENSRQRKAEAS